MPTSPPQTPRRVLITGSAGLIGSSLCREFLALGWQVLGLDDYSSGWAGRHPRHPAFRWLRIDVGRAGALREILASEAPFEAVVHLAARVGVKAVLRDPEACRSSNLAGVRELVLGLEALPDASRPRVYAASTSEVYTETNTPLSESAPTRSTLGEGRWAYAASKLEGERWLDAGLGRQAGVLGPVHLRFFNVVGPGQDAESGMVLANFVEQVQRGEDLTVHGDGTQVRTFAHVDEVARTLAQLVATGDCPAGPLNVGGTARASIGELARCVLRLARSPRHLRFTDPRVDTPNFEAISYREPDLERLRATRVDLPAASLEDIVRITLSLHSERARRLPRPARAPVCASPAS